MAEDHETDATRGDAAADKVELLLSGDFSSPSEVLAERAFSSLQKRQILELWIEDLRSAPDNDDTRRVLRSVRDALATVDAEGVQDR